MSATIQEALERAEWFARYALDRLPNDRRRFHPGVASHLTAARAQLTAAVELAHHEHDQPPK